MAQEQLVIGMFQILFLQKFAQSTIAVMRESRLTAVKLQKQYAIKTLVNASKGNVLSKEIKQRKDGNLDLALACLQI